jgi:hypothetical protein
MKSWGFLWRLLAAESAILLGLINLLYSFHHNIFLRLTAETAIELLILLQTLSLDPIIASLLLHRRGDFLC